jgi:serine/threonine protein kinase
MSSLDNFQHLEDQNRYSELERHLHKPPTSQEQSPERAQTILWNEYEVGDLIGSGSFGHVYKCRNLKTGKHYAIKKFKNKFPTQKKAFE